MTQYDKNGQRIWQLPLKVDVLVRDNRADMTKRVVAEAKGCPLKGRYSTTVTAELEDRMQRGSGSREAEGCLALHDPICYLERSSSRSHRSVYHPQISCKEECPVYQRVQKILGEEK